MPGWSWAWRRLSVAKGLSQHCTIRYVHNTRTLRRQTAKINKSCGQQDDISQTPAKQPLRLDDERKTRSRHLLRAILRECTYLPDSFARQWMTRYALSRFRTYWFKVWKHRNDSDFNDRLIKKERGARQYLGILRRANEGERERLLKVLFMVYGRTGKRRYELMRPLLSVKGQSLLDGRNRGEDEEAATPIENDVECEDEQHESLDDGTVDDGLSDTENERPATMRRAITDDLDLTPQLRALLISQIKTRPPALTRTNPRRLKPLIPELNSWHRPMPQARVKNMKHKHYAELLDRTLPPLPEDEWMRLRDLASGRVPIEASIQRRKAPIVSKLVDGGSLEAIVKYGRVPENAFNNRNAHTVTMRFMRRLYKAVFSQCPLMELDTTDNTWTVTWGGKALLESSNGTNSTATSSPNSGILQLKGYHMQKRPKLTTSA